MSEVELSPENIGLFPKTFERKEIMPPATLEDRANDEQAGEIGGYILSLIFEKP